MEKIKINFKLKTKTLDASEYIAFCKQLILSLQSFDEIFSTVSVWDNESKKDYYFKGDLSDFNVEAIKLIIMDKTEIAYLNPASSDKNLTAFSKSWTGFNSSFGFENNDIFMSIKQGSYEKMPAYIEFEFNNFQDKLTKTFIIDLINILCKAADVEFTNVITSELSRKVRNRGKNTIGWINYSKNMGLLSVLSKDEIEKEINGGIIFSLLSGGFFGDITQAVIDRSIEISNFLGPIKQAV